VYYRPGLHRAPAFAAGTPRALPVTDRLSERMICLPVYSDFTEGELADLARAVEAALAESTTA
jgi:dTDP-4-amino-4,6-dideoxygalactose transaminase